jgi:HK97 family phage portal protein
MLAQRWQEGYGGDNVGGVAVLDQGAMPTPVSVKFLDAEIEKLYRLSIEDVARAFRIPLYMLGVHVGGGLALRTVESLQRGFITQTLDFYLSHIGFHLDELFRLPRGEALEFDVELGMMRGEFGEQINGLAKGVQGSIFTPNEARRRMNLPPDDEGNNLLAQAQMVEVGADPEPPPPEPEPIDEDALAAALAREFEHAA